MKTKFWDFTSAFLIAFVVFFAVVLVAEQDFISGAITINDNYSITIFGVNIGLSHRLIETFERLLKFNDNIFGKPFVTMIGKGFAFMAEYTKQFFVLLWNIVRVVIGAV